MNIWCLLRYTFDKHFSFYLSTYLDCECPKLANTVVEKTNRPSPIFHTKLTFLRGFFETKRLKNCLILLRVNRYMQGEHKLKFWLKNIHKYQNGSMSFFSFIFWLTKLGLFILIKEGHAAILKFVNIFEPKLQIMFFLYILIGP